MRRPFGCGGQEPFELARHVGPARLVHDLGDAVRGELGDPVADHAGRAAEGHVREHRVPARAPRRPVGSVQLDAVPDVHGEVALVRGRPLDDVHPLAAAGERADRVGAAELVGAVVGQRPAGPARDPGVVGVGGLGLVEHGAPRQVGHPRVGACELRELQREVEAVTQLAGHGVALRAERADEDRHVDRPGGGVASRVQHLHPRALPLDDLAAQQPAVGLQVVPHVRPRDGAVAHRAPPAEAGAEGDRDPARGERDERGRGGGVDHRVAQAGHQHARTQPDPLGALGGQRERHPDVRALLRRVVHPRAVVAHALGQGDVAG
jgi:hypothetical protein